MFPTDFHPETRYFYSILSEEERAFYKFLVERLSRLEFEFLLFDPEKAPLSEADVAGGLPAFPCREFDELTFACLNITYIRLLEDCPEFYYAYNSELHFDPDTRTARIGSGKPEYTPEEIKKYNAALDEMLHLFDHITDDFELELAVHDYVIERFRYDRNDAYTGRYFNEMFTVIGFLERGGAVCSAYTFLVQFILQKRGIPCAHLVGSEHRNDTSQPELHAWLAVKIKGHYYHLDVTFDDTDEEWGLCSYSHFNLTDEEIKRDREYQSEYFPGIVCDSTAYNYFVATNSIFRDKASISAAAKDLVEKSLGRDSIAYLRFRAPDLFWEEIEEAAIRPIGRFLTDYDGYFHEPDVYVIKLILKNSRSSPDKNKTNNNK